MMEERSTSAKAILRDKRGTVAVFFAVAAMPILVVLGGGIDFMQVTRARSLLQQALDTATLAATSNTAAANTLLNTNDSSGALFSNISVSWTNNSDGSVTGTATGQVRTTFLQLVHLPSIPITVSSTAAKTSAQTPSSVIFTLTGAYGWYWKEVDLYTHTVGASSDTLVASYIYQPIDLSDQSGRGTGTTTATFLSGGSMVAGQINTQISLGSNYDNAYLTMTVYSDGCGPGMAPTTPQSGSTTNYTCVMTGTKQGRTTYTKTATPVVYSTTNAAQSRNLFVNGVNMYSTSVPPSITRVLPCPASGVSSVTNTHAWEDTPYSGSLNTGSWSQQDVFFNVQTSCGANQFSLGRRSSSNRALAARQELRQSQGPIDGSRWLGNTGHRARPEA